MDPLATQLIEHDRGLGTAYERWCFYQLVDEWARRYDVTSALEGPVDGMAGVSGVHLVGLARRGVRVTSASLRDEKAQLARAVYERAGAGEHAQVRVVLETADIASALEPADLVIVYHALPLVDGWRDYLRTMARLARKLLVVTVCNPDNWGVAAIRAAGRLRGRRDVEAPETWRTDVLAPELWALGQVRDHVYFDAPWWPDLQVAPGQSLLDRATQLFSWRRGPMRFTAAEEGAALSERFVYGAARWPYFGGDGWVDELLPALLRHPGFDGTQWRWRSRVAHLHGFVVDVRPRTPQGRRKLTRVE
ncbi:MAG TPA: hypothetical protein VGL81_33880 [Polyangiaceae bacterium]